jgi:hypothetical protein
MSEATKLQLWKKSHKAFAAILSPAASQKEGE